MLKLDLHVHTRYSKDGFCSIRDIVRAAKSRGLDGVAITDHNTIAGHEEARKYSKEIVIIPGVEISTAHGHVVALGVHETIPRGLSPKETVKRIREQGGVAIAAHPFIFGKNPGLVYRAKFDAIEVLNGRGVLFANSLASNFAKKNGLRGVGGSDAHRLDEVGLAWTEVECRRNVDDILEILREGETSVSGRVLPLPVFLWRALQKVLLHR
ncbi:MAG: PHP domain-containing protein [Candidatus Hadarchaeales archaeon]